MFKLNLHVVNTKLSFHLVGWKLKESRFINFLKICITVGGREGVKWELGFAFFRLGKWDLLY